METQLANIDRFFQMLLSWLLTNGVDIIVTVILVLIALKISKLVGKSSLPTLIKTSKVRPTLPGLEWRTKRNLWLKTVLDNGEGPGMKELDIQ